MKNTIPQSVSNQKKDGRVTHQSFFWYPTKIFRHVFTRHTDSHYTRPEFVSLHADASSFFSSSAGAAESSFFATFAGGSSSSAGFAASASELSSFFSSKTCNKKFIFESLFAKTLSESHFSNKDF